MIETATHIKDLHELLEQVANSIVNRINKYNKKSINQILQNAMKYICENYAMSITLNELADHTYVSTYYLSRMFKKELGKNFVEYLSEVRIEKAKELLTQAGYPDGFTFTITVPSNYQQHVDTAQILAEEFKKIGVTAEINLIEWDSWLSDVYSDRNYESTVIGVDASSLTARALLERFTTDNSGNFVLYSNPDYDAVFEKAMNETNEEAKTEYYKECQKILAQDAVNVYIQDLPQLVAVNKKFAGYEFYPVYVQDISKMYIVE